MGKENDCYDSSVKMFTLKQQQILANVKLTNVIVTMFIDRVPTMTAVYLWALALGHALTAGMNRSQR